MRIIIVFLSFLLTNCQLPWLHPVIGVYTQQMYTGDPNSQNYHPTTSVTLNKSYIAASYIKFVEMSGALVIPLFAYSNKSYYDNILPKINGVMFPGGIVEVDIKNKWTQNSEYIMKFAMNQTKNGRPFPIWGTCQGLQQLAYLTSGYDSNIMVPIKGQIAVQNSLQVTPENTLFKDLPQDLLTSLQSSDRIFYFNHHFAITRDYYNKNKLLNSFWDVEAFTTTSFNEQFISVFKAKQYPFYGIQFHAEKILFEWKTEVGRSDNGVRIVQILSNKFIQIARKNTNKFPSNKQFIQLSLVNYKTSSQFPNFNQIYFFKEITSSFSQTSHDKKHLQIG